MRTAGVLYQGQAGPPAVSWQWSNALPLATMNASPGEVSDGIVTVVSNDPSRATETCVNGLR